MNLIEINEHKRRMDTLGRNLAVAGALAESFRAGWHGWAPNTDGRAWRP
jgi:hypothetical protein